MMVNYCVIFLACESQFGGFIETFQASVNEATAAGKPH